jgi:hypothetical protein
MDTDVPGTRTLISGTCVLILPNSVPGCCCDWYMLAHPALLFFRLHPAGPPAPECGTFVAPERHRLGKKQGNHSFKSYKVACCPQAPSFPWARARASAGALDAGARAAGARAARAARAANLRFKVVLYRP